MAETKRGMAMLMTSGDPEISGALADGILAAKALLPMPVETEEAAIIRKRATEALRRIDMRYRRSEDDDDDIEARILKARENYATPIRKPSLFRMIGDKMLGIYARAVIKIHDYFDFRNDRWVG